MTSKTKTFEISYFHFIIALLIIFAFIGFNLIIYFVFLNLFKEHPILWIIILEFLFPIGIFAILFPDFYFSLKKEKEKKRIHFTEKEKKEI